MADLTGTKVASTYKNLLQVDNSNIGLDSTLRAVSGGGGTDSALKISTGAVSVDNIKIDGNVISAIDTNGSITFTPDGTGDIVLGSFTLDADQTVGAGQDNYVLTYDHSSGKISLEAAGAGGIANVVEDTTPQAGGDFDMNSYDIQFDDATGIRDDSDNEQLIFSKTASAVNHLQIANAATGNDPAITAVGDDTNIGITIDGKGTGTIAIGSADSVVTLDGTSITGTLTTGSDTKVVSGTAGTSGNLAQWDANGDAIDSSLATSNVMDLDSSQEYTATKNFNATTLSDGATINWDASSNQVASVTLGGNRTMAAPTNLVDGGTYILHVIQDGTGSRTLTWNSVFKWSGGTAPTLTTTASARDIISFISDGTNLYGVATLDFS